MIRATRNPFPLNREFKTGPQLRTSALRNRCRTPHLPGPLVPPFLLDVLPRQESFASLHILTRRASEGSEALPSLARRVRMSFFGARVIVRGGLSVSRFSRKGSNTGMLQNWS